MADPNLAVVTGAFSYTGGYVARRLIDEGVPVRTLSRRPAGRQPAGGPRGNGPDGLLGTRTGCAGRWRERTSSTTPTGYGSHTGRPPSTTRSRTPGRCSRRLNGAGVGRIVHFSVSNASTGLDLPYFRGKAHVEDMLVGLGIPYAIIRPTLVYGDGDLLLNNMAWALRRFPLFPVCGSGDYPVQPVYAEEPCGPGGGGRLAGREFRGRRGRAGDVLLRGAAPAAGLLDGRPRAAGPHARRRWASP